MKTTMTRAEKIAKNRLEKEIERLYGVHAVGRQIDIMKIGALFADVEKAVAGGAAVEQAVIDAVARYTETTSPEGTEPACAGDFMTDSDR